MSLSNVLFAVVCFICSLIFGVFALWAFKRNDPMHFWSGRIVRPEEISDIRSYNRANGIMWIIYTVCMMVTSLVSLFSIKLGTFLLVIICVPGVIVLIAIYNRIYRKYRVTSVIYENDKSTSKTPKAIVIAITSITVIMFIVLGVLFYYGEQDPVAIMHDDSIQIKTLYGLNINFSEITSVSLIDKSMSEIGVSVRTNGYRGFGGARKGYFKSDTLGSTLQFVQSKTAPTIKIERINKDDIYISFRSSEKAEQLYWDILAMIPLD